MARGLRAIFGGAAAASILTAAVGCDKHAEGETAPVMQQTSLAGKPTVLFLLFGDHNDPRILPVATIGHGRISPITLDAEGWRKFDALYFTTGAEIPVYREGRHSATRWCGAGCGTATSRSTSCPAAERCGRSAAATLAAASGRRRHARAAGDQRSAAPGSDATATWDPRWQTARARSRPRVAGREGLPATDRADLELTVQRHPHRCDQQADARGARTPSAGAAADRALATSSCSRTPPATGGYDAIVRAHGKGQRPRVPAPDRSRRPHRRRRGRDRARRLARWWRHLSRHHEVRRPAAGRRLRAATTPGAPTHREEGSALFDADVPRLLQILLRVGAECRERLRPLQPRHLRESSPSPPSRSGRTRPPSRSPRDPTRRSRSRRRSRRRSRPGTAPWREWRPARPG